jgi:gas vesicle protein
MGKKKKGTIWDKILMGAVIGGAIGSVLGASIAPNKGEDTRKEIKETAKKAKKGSIKIIHKIKKLILRKPSTSETQTEEESKKIPHEHV